MNKLLLIPLLCVLCTVANAQQNHVPNPSFEDTLGCPTSVAQVTPKCANWIEFFRSADYDHSCTNGLAGVPNNFAGYQHAAHGNAYIGLCAFYTGVNFEYVGVHIQPLTTGAVYEVSMSVSLANVSRFATNNLGVFFYDTIGTPTASSILPMLPQVHYSNLGVVTDTANWVRLTKTFVADSAYDNIVIGGFYDSNNTYTIDTLTSSTGGYAYYYIDSVVIKLAKNFGINFKDTALCAGETIKVPYYAQSSGVFFQSNNVFTLQLSDASGSFVNPVNIGTKTSNSSDTIIGVIPVNTPTGSGYKIRMVSSNAQDTTYDNGRNIGIGTALPAKPVAGNNSPVCYNDTLTFTASSSTSGVSYRWSGPGGFNTTIQNPTIPNPVPANGGDYEVTAYIYGCESKDTTTAIVHAGSGPIGTTATTNAPVCADDTLRLFGTANGTSNTYSWIGPNSFTSNMQNPVLSNASATQSGDYVLYASNGNCVSRDTVTVLVKPRPAAFTSSSNSPLCTGTSINFSTSSTSTGVSYAWSGPNSFNSTSATPFINGASVVHNGNYYVTATLNGCVLHDTLAVTVKPLPAKPVANTNSPLCVGETLNMTATSTANGVSYSWTGPGSYASTTQNPTISSTTTAMTGNYIVSAVLSGCTTKDTVSVLVKPLPTPISLTNNSPLCDGDTLILSSSASSTGATYSWSGPQSFASTVRNTSINGAGVTATGWYKMVVDLNSCIYADSIFATVNAIPATPGITFNSPLCIGETLNLSAGNVNGVTYSWTGPGSYTSGLQNPSRSNMQFADTGSYIVTATANGCTSPEGSTKVYINPTPFVVILANPADSICQGDPAVFTALPNNHGGTPDYRWMVNTQNAGTGVVFNTTALNDGDVISCEMTEHTKCSVSFKDESNDITMTVLPWLAPSVTISASPNHPLDQYEYVTFTATPTDAGTNPTYQWKRNGQIQTGATSNVWSANTLNDNDSVSVEIISSYKCPQPTTAISNWIKIRLTEVDDIKGLGKLVLYPNPNKGKFILEGVSAGTKDKTLIGLEVLNTLGQIVYTDEVLQENGTLHKEIDLGGKPQGIYLLRLHTANAVDVLRFTVHE